MIRAAYLDAAESAVALLARPEVAAGWDGASALAEFSVRGLAGHLGVQVFAVSRAVAKPDPEVAPISVGEFFTRSGAAYGGGVDAETNVWIRSGGEKSAGAGPAGLVAGVESAVTQLRTALAKEPEERAVSFLGLPLSLDDFLLTRLVEIVVHIDDLAVSVGIEPPQFPAHVFEPVLDVLARLAVTRHGQTAVLRGLSRSERAPETIAGI